jgi:hypothetical protein
VTASNPDDFALKVKGIQSTSDLTWEAEEKGKASTKPGTDSPQKQGEASEYKGKSTDSDFKIDRFGDK